MKEALGDKSSVPKTKETLLHAFRRRIDSIDIQRYRIIQRFGRALLDEGDKSLDFSLLLVNSALDNLGLQAQMTIERCERLKNNDAFDGNKERIKLNARLAEIYEEHRTQSEHSLIRMDDIEVFMRMTLPEYAKRRSLNKLITAISWLPYSTGKDIWIASRNTMTQVALEVERNTEKLIDQCKTQMATDLMSAGISQKEAELKVSRFSFSHTLGSPKQDWVYGGKYQHPPLYVKDISSLKVLMKKYGSDIGLSSTIDINLDRGHSYCRELYFHFNRLYSKQTIESTYPHYESSLEEASSLQNYERLAKLAEKEKGVIGNKGRLMETRAYPSRLYSGDSWCNQRMWEPKTDLQEEEIWCTINAVVGTQIDKLIEVEAQLIDINDLSQVEELLDQAATQYLEHHLSSTDINQEIFNFEEASVDLSSLEVLKEPESEIKENDKEKEREGQKEKNNEETPSKDDAWKHIIKAYLSERLILMREYKRKMAYAFNYFRSVERRLTHDIVEIASNHSINSGNLETKSSNPQSKRNFQISQKKKSTEKPNEQLLERPSGVIHEDSGFPLLTKGNASSTSYHPFNIPNPDESAKNEAFYILRLEKIEENECRLMDHQGVNVFLESALKDVQDMMKRMMLVGTYYIQQFENRQGLFRKDKKSVVDRTLTLLDLLRCECEYQYAKLDIVERLMYVYEHTTDYIEIQNTGQAIIDMIAKRPRHQLVSEYFLGHYAMEKKCLQQYSQLITTIILGQTRVEKTIDEDNARGVEQKVAAYNRIKTKKGELSKKPSEIIKSKGEAQSSKDGKKATATIPDPYRGADSELHNKRLEDILELDSMKEEDLYIAHKKMLEKEECEDNYPAYYEFTLFKEGWHSCELKEEPAVAPLNSAIFPELPAFSIRAFYSSLSETVRVIMTIQKALNSFSLFFKPESGFAISSLETEIIASAIKEYTNIQEFVANPPSEISDNMKSIEQATIADSPEMLVFLLKELLRDLNKASVFEVNPFYVARLSVEEMAGIDFSVFQDKLALSKHTKGNAKWPLMIRFACNLVEFTRIHEAIINSLYESYLLGKTYKMQQDFSSQSVPLLNLDPIQFVNFKTPFKDYTDCKPCSSCKLNLAAQEIDPSYGNLMCLHKDECIKHILFDGGIEEMRGVLHSQLMQGQLLMIATQINHWMYLPYLRGFAELEGITASFNAKGDAKKQAFELPNGVLGLRVGEDPRVYMREKEKLRGKMIHILNDCFVDISKAKRHQRSVVQTAYQTFLNKYLKLEESGKQIRTATTLCTSRALKAYKLYLAHVYCELTLQQFYQLSLHSDLFLIANSLRDTARMFPEDEIFLESRKSYGLEAVPFNLGLSYGLDEIEGGTGKIKATFELSNTLLSIPSSEDIAFMVKNASRDSITEMSNITYELIDTAPEDLAKTAATNGIGEISSLKKKKKWSRNDDEKSLYTCKTLTFEYINSLSLIRNILILEFIIESAGIPVKLWMQLIRGFRMNMMPWLKIQRTKESVLDPSPVMNEERSEAVQALNDEIMGEHRLSHLEHVLRAVAHKLRVIDYTLFKTCGMKTTNVIDYFYIYYKYKYLSLTESLYKLLDDFPLPIGKNEEYPRILKAINILTQQRIGTPTYTSSGMNGQNYFRFIPGERIDIPFNEQNKEYNKNYYVNLVPERWDDEEILRLIKDDLHNRWKTHRIANSSDLGEMPLCNLILCMQNCFTSEEVRKLLVSHISIVEGKAQVQYMSSGPEDAMDEDEEFYILPVEVVKQEELKEQANTLKEKVRLRRFRFSLMAWFTRKPISQNPAISLEQRKILLDNTFIEMMNIKEDIEFEANKLDLPRNVILRKETAAEIFLLKCLISKEFLSKGIECIKQEQALVADLLEKGANSVESSLLCQRGTAATLFSNVDPEQRKCIVNTMSHVQSFVTQIKNRATLIESLTTGTAMILNLHDFNSSMYSLCKNIWRQLMAQFKTSLWSERKLQHQLHQQTHIEIIKKKVVVEELTQLKENSEHRISVEVGQRCCEQIYEVEKAQRQCEFWVKKIKSLSKRIRKELREELKQEIQEKVVQLKNYETQFADYKDTLMTQLKAEITSNNASLSKKFQVVPGSKALYSKSIKLEAKGSNEEEEKTADAYEELAKLQEKVHKLRIFQNMRLVLQKRKYKDKMALISKEMSTNGSLWGELSLAERREVILKQELLNAQQNLASCERALKQLQASLKEKNSTLMRFQQTKNSKVQKLEELENKLRRCTLSEAVDVNGLQMELMRKERELVELRGAVNTSEDKVECVKSSYKTQIRWMQNKLKTESNQKNAAIQKLEEMQILLQQTTTKATDSKAEEAGLWREKCKELVEICKSLKSENEMYRGMLADQPRAQMKSEDSKDFMKEKDSRAETPYSQMGFPARGYSRGMPKNSRTPLPGAIGICGSNKQYTQKPGTLPSTKTRSSSNSGINKSFSSREPTPIVNMRPQTEHHPFFVQHKKRLQSGAPQPRHVQNHSEYNIP